MTHRHAKYCVVLVVAAVVCTVLATSRPDSRPPDPSAMPAVRQSETAAMSVTDNQLLDPLPQSESEWKTLLTSQQYFVLRQKGTEQAYAGEYWDAKSDGVYRCAGCGQTLFSAEHKYNSGTGWPSFWQPISAAHVDTQSDNTLFLRRTEVVCSRCQGHLGHVFNDGPQPSGLRYCMNSAALRLDTSPPDDGETSTD